MRNLPAADTRAPLARVALLFIGFVAVLGVVYAFTVRTVTGRELADASLRGAINAQPLVSDTVESILDVVSVGSLLGAVAVVAFIALVRLARLEGLVAVGLLLGANLTTWLLKNVFLTRPDLDLDEIAPATLNSLPSGHATAVFSSVVALLVVAPRPLRDVTATVGAGYAALTGVATMLAGWHRASDSVGAFLVVGVWACVAAAVLIVSGHSGTNAPSPAARPASVRWLSRTAVYSLSLATLLTIGLVLASLAPDNPLGAAAAFAAGGFVILGAAAAVTVGVLELLRVVETQGAAPSARSRP